MFHDGRRMTKQAFHAKCPSCLFLQGDLHGGDGAKDTLSIRIAKYSPYPLGCIHTDPFNAFQHLRKSNDTIAGIKSIGCRQNRLVVGNAIAQQLNRFEAVMDKAPVPARIRKCSVKLFAYPEAPVVLIFKEVNPESKRQFRDDLSRPGCDRWRRWGNRLGFRLNELVTPVR